MAVDKKACPKCKRTVNTDGKIKFCYEDGAELVDAQVCECGRVLHSADKFCEECGKKVEKAEARKPVQV